MYGRNHPTCIMAPLALSYILLCVWDTSDIILIQEAVQPKPIKPEFVCSTGRSHIQFQKLLLLGTHLLKWVASHRPDLPIECNHHLKVDEVLHYGGVISDVEHQNSNSLLVDFLVHQYHHFLGQF